MRHLLATLGFVAALAGGGCGDEKTTDACVDTSSRPPTCTNFTADRESNQFNCSSMTQGRGTFHPGQSCSDLGY